MSFDELKEGMASVGSKYNDADIRAFFDKVGLVNLLRYSRTEIVAAMQYIYTYTISSVSLPLVHSVLCLNLTTI